MKYRKEQIITMTLDEFCNGELNPELFKDTKKITFDFPHTKKVDLSVLENAENINIVHHFPNIEILKLSGKLKRFSIDCSGIGRQPDISGLHHLTHLHMGIYYKRIFGELDIPESITHLTLYGDISLHNALLGNFPNLIKFNIQNSFFRKSVDATRFFTKLYRYSNLAHLSIGFSHILFKKDYKEPVLIRSGNGDPYVEYPALLFPFAIPEGISSLANLKYLYLSSRNMLIFPEDICELKNLKKLHLGQKVDFKFIQKISEKIPEIIVESHEITFDNDKKSHKISCFEREVKKFNTIFNNFEDFSDKNKLKEFPEIYGKLLELSDGRDPGDKSLRHYVNKYIHISV